MKNILPYTVLLMVLLACDGRDETLLMGRAEDRLDEISAGYREQLVSAPAGWKAFVFPAGGRGYGFFMEFDSEGRVTMLGDVNEACATKTFQSSFRLEAVQRPSLFFDTYSYLHILADPDPDTVGGEPGHGLKSDFEFAFEHTRGDTITLKGNQHGSVMELIRATPAERDAYRAKALDAQRNTMTAYLEKNPFSYLPAPDGKRLNIRFNEGVKTISISYRQGDALNIQTSPFGFSDRGMYLQKPLQYKDMIVREIFSDGNEKFYIVWNGKRIDIVPSATAILPLHLMLGVDFSVISTLVGGDLNDDWSDSYKNFVLDASTSLGGKGLILKYIEFEFNTLNKTVNLNVFVASETNGTLYRAQFFFLYTISADGVWKFSQYQQPDGNGKFIEPDLKGLLFYLETYRFRMDYLMTPAGYVAQVKCVERPTFISRAILEALSNLNRR